MRLLTVFLAIPLMNKIIKTRNIPLCENKLVRYAKGKILGNKEVELSIILCIY